MKIPNQKSVSTQKKPIHKNAVDSMHGENYFDEPVNQTIYHEFKNQHKKRTMLLRLTLILIALNLVLIIQSFCQVVTINNTSISNTTQITIKGDMVSGAGTDIENDGTIILTGNFTNNSGTGLFGGSNGTVILNGSNHLVGGSAVTNFHNLILQATGDITLQNNIVVGGNNLSNSGVLSLGSNLLKLNSNELIISNPNANAISRTSGFIVSESNSVAGYSPVKWMLNNHAGNYIFPFGSSVTGHYLPVTFEITSAGTGPNGYISLATYPTATNALPNNRPLPSGLNSLMNIFGTENAANVIDRWWVMDVAGYSNLPVSSVTFSYRDSEWDQSSGSNNTIIENTLQAQSNNYSVWTPVQTSSINTIANTITVSNLNFYNPLWTLSGNNTPLPMELLVFDASLKQNNTVDINWVTATEINNDYFTIEKSSNGINFEPLGYVQGAGNSSVAIHYNTVDNEPFAGISYYRLKQTDYDGNYTYSSIRAVKISNNPISTVKAFPNPASDFFFINFDKDLLSGDILIADLNGKIVKVINYLELRSTGNEIIKIDVNNLASGLYTISVPGDGVVKIAIN